MALVEAAVKESAPPERPVLRIAAPPPLREPARSLDDVTRLSHIRMIRHYARRYRVKVLVDQALFGKRGLEELDDDALVKLHRDLERARECLEDGISFEDAGLLKSQVV